MAHGNFWFHEQSVATPADSDSMVTETSTVDQSDAVSCEDSCCEADQMSEFVCIPDELDAHSEGSSFLGKRQTNQQEVADYFSGETVHLRDCRNITPTQEDSDEVHPETAFVPPPTLEFNLEPQNLSNNSQSELSQLILPPPKKAPKTEVTNQRHLAMKPPKHR